MVPTRTWYGVPQCAAVTTQVGETSEPPQVWLPEALCSDAMNEYVSVAGTPPTIFGLGGGVGSALATEVPASVTTAAGRTASR
ncbi:hypothetical protein GCM10009678_84350 [Actinomadura kijaniata]